MLVDAFNEMLEEIQKRDSALQESERQFRTLADSIPQLAWMAEPDGDLFWYNHRWYEYTGTSPNKCSVGAGNPCTIPRFFPKLWRTWKSSLATGQPFEMIFPLRGADGDFVIF